MDVIREALEVVKKDPEDVSADYWRFIVVELIKYIEELRYCK